MRCFRFQAVPRGEGEEAFGRSKRSIGAKYASGLYDANDLAAAYNEGYNAAFQKVVLEVMARLLAKW